ncbi:MAG: HD domain-containing protein [Lachnospiraceae bacterium]|nr:HD domain-containing protein [Lachnospiraceae bacterium]
MSDLLDQAIAIAKDAHKDQKDKANRPYFLHPQTVASFVDTEEEKIVAYLHDVMEDHPDYMTERGFRELFGDRVTDALLLLRHDRDDTYAEYIEKIRRSNNLLAIRVKLADLRHNTDVSRGITITDPEERDRFYAKRNEKVQTCYMPAIRSLSEQLRVIDEAVAAEGVGHAENGMSAYTSSENAE